MEVSGIDHITTIKSVKGGKPIQSDRIHDELALSPGAQQEAMKIDQWVEDLKAMPEIREESLERAFSLRETPEILKAVANKLFEQ